MVKYLHNGRFLKIFPWKRLNFKVNYVCSLTCTMLFKNITCKSDENAIFQSHENRTLDRQISKQKQTTLRIISLFSSHELS